MLKIDFNYYKAILQYVKNKVYNNEEFTMKEMYSHFVGDNLIPIFDYYYTIEKLVESDYVLYSYSMTKQGEFVMSITCISDNGCEFLKIMNDEVWKKVKGGINGLGALTLDTLKIVFPILKEKVNSIKA